RLDSAIHGSVQFWKALPDPFPGLFRAFEKVTFKPWGESRRAGKTK
ncbi:hypothetical protein MDG893_01405, partial [Marinobacter algicola DG893]